MLTGCIDPNNMSFTKLQDIDTRKKHYLESIKYYLNETNLSILFVENSGYDISDSFVPEVNSGRLEILTFNGNNYNRLLGKGYGEMLILEYASTFSNLFKTADFIFKITGRYRVLNIQSYINYYFINKNSFDILINFKPDLSFVDSRFWGAKSLFFTESLIKYKDIIDDSNSIHFEHALCKAVHDFINNGFIYSGLNHYPRYSGIYGTDGSRYNDSWLHWIVREILVKILNFIQKKIQIS